MVYKCLFCGKNTLNQNKMCDKCKESRTKDAVIELYSEFPEETAEPDPSENMKAAKARFRKNQRKLTPTRFLANILICGFSMVAATTILYMVLLVTDPIKADKLVQLGSVGKGINFERKETDEQFKESCRAYSVDTLVKKSTKYEGTRVYITGLAQTTGTSSHTTDEYKFELIVDKTQGIKDYDTAGLADIQDKIDQATRDLSNILNNAAKDTAGTGNIQPEEADPSIYISYTGNITESLLDGATVDIYGTFQGMYTYTNSDGKVCTVPMIKAKILEYN